MELIDSHCHLEPSDFTANGVDEREAVIARAGEAGVRTLVCIGSGRSLDEVHNALRMAESYPNVWAAIAIHPHYVADLTPETLRAIEELAATHPRVVAIGETGLDYHYEHAPRERQRDALRAFLQIARRTRRPVSLHIREAHSDARAILAEEGIHEVGGVVHCFTGTRDDAEAYVALGLHISFSGVITFKNAVPIQEAAAWVPADRFIVETDCPFLAPVPMRGRRNEPAYLVYTAAALATVRGVAVETIAAQSSATARRLFRIDKSGNEG